MTLGQFSYLVGAAPKWVLNALRVLGRSGQYDIHTARILRLAHILGQSLGTGLKQAWELAAGVVGGDGLQTAWTLTSPDGSVSLGIDRQRFLSSFACALSASREWYRERPRGRPSRRPLGQRLVDQGSDVASLLASRALTPDERLDRVDDAFRLLAPGSRPDPCLGELLDRLRQRRIEFVVVGPLAAALHGSLRIPTALDIWPGRGSRNLERLERLLREMRAELRSVGPGFPFLLDRITLQTQPVIPLATPNGDLTVHASVPGVAAADLGGHAVEMEVGGAPLRVLDIEPLYRSLVLRDGREEREIAFELETLMELRLED